MFFPKERKLLNLGSMIVFLITGWCVSFFLECETYYPLFLLLSLIYYDGREGYSSEYEGYLDDKTGDVYDASYFDTSFTLFVSIFWVVVGYRESGLITIDVVFFLCISFYLFPAWFMICFIPEDGFSQAEDYNRKSFLMAFCMLMLVFYVVWLFYNFNGWGWFSKILLNPFHFIF